MRIAVTYDNGNVFPKFCKSNTIKVYQIENGEIEGSTIINSNLPDNSAMVSFIKSLKADAVVSDCISESSRTQLNRADIQYYAGVSGKCDNAVMNIIKNI